MTTKRAAPSRSGKAERTSNTTTRTTKSSRTGKSAELSAQEEKVVRMRRGATVPVDRPLGRVGQDNAKTRAWLAAFEARAFAMSGRVDALRREARGETEAAATARPAPAVKSSARRAAAPAAPSAPAVPAADRARKEKIISRLTKKETPAAKSRTPAGAPVARTKAKKR